MRLSLRMNWQICRCMLDLTGLIRPWSCISCRTSKTSLPQQDWWVWIFRASFSGHRRRRLRVLLKRRYWQRAHFTGKDQKAKTVRSDPCTHLFIRSSVPRNVVHFWVNPCMRIKYSARHHLSTFDHNQKRTQFSKHYYILVHFSNALKLW